MTMFSPRARIVLIEHGKVALIRRVRDGHTYYLFPGGGERGGEPPEEPARREAVEELGVEVELGPLVHQESFGGTIFLYYDAWIVGGSFGTGSWPDHALLTDRERERSGTHEPVWVALEDLPGLDIRPRALGALLTPWRRATFRSAFETPPHDRLRPHPRSHARPSSVTRRRSACLWSVGKGFDASS